MGTQDSVYGQVLVELSKKEAPEYYQLRFSSMCVDFASKEEIMTLDELRELAEKLLQDVFLNNQP